MSDQSDDRRLLRQVLAYLRVIDAKLDLVLLKEDEMTDTLDDVVADVAAENTVIDSAIALLNGIDARIAAAGEDPAKLAALRSDIQAKKQALAEAVAANTPVPPVAPTA